MLTLVLHLDTINKITALNKHFYKTDHKASYYRHWSKTKYRGTVYLTTYVLREEVIIKLLKLPLYAQCKNVIHFNNTFWNSVV